MRCPKCGRENKSEANYCRACGQDLTVINTSETEPEEFIQAKVKVTESVKADESGKADEYVKANEIDMLATKRLFMRCPKCGRENKSEANYCRACGQDLTVINTSETEPEELIQAEVKVTESVKADESGKADESVKANESGKANSRKSVIAGISVLGAVLLLAITGYFVGNNVFGPDKLVKEYVTAIVDQDWSKAYSYLNTDEIGSPFITEDKFIELCSTSDNKIADYTMTDVSDGYNKSYLIKCIQYNDEEDSFKVNLKKQKKNNFLFFDSYKVSLDDYATNEYSVYIPNGTVLSFDGKTIDQRYRTASTEDYDLYTLPYVFYGKHDILVTGYDYNDYQNVVYVYGQDSYKLYSSSANNNLNNISDSQSISSDISVDPPQDGNSNGGSASRSISIDKSSTYQVVISDATWENANEKAGSAGGHLVYVNNAEEFTKVCNMAYNAGLRVFWLGAKRYDNQSWSEVSWRNGKSMNFTKWFSNEPSYVSEEGYSENYLMCFYVDGQWYYNDAFNDVQQYYSKKMGYIIEFEGGNY